MHIRRLKPSAFGLELLWLEHTDSTFKADDSSWSMQTTFQQRGFQPSLQAAMKVAECRREMAVAAQAGREPVLASQTQTGSESGEYGL